MQIERIPFPPIGSNMYVVTQGRDAIVLDPWPDEATMQRLQGYHALIVLTHEHIDHISGLGRMQRALSARTLWQENCTPWLRNPGNTTPVLLAALSVSRGAEARDFLRGLHHICGQKGSHQQDHQPKEQHPGHMEKAKCRRLPGVLRDCEEL